MYVGGKVQNFCYYIVTLHVYLLYSLSIRENDFLQ